MTDTSSRDETPGLLEEVIDKHIALLTINRPRARNAIDAQVAALLSDAVKRLEGDPTIRVTILTAAGDAAFCAGADLRALARGEHALLRTQLGGFAGFVNFPRTKPWIAAVNGPALAGGCELALACDIIIASDNASFGLPEVKRGLVAAGGGAYRLARALPRGLAIELALTGDSIPASRALAHGLISRLTSSDTLREEAILLANRIAANAPLAVRESLAIVRQADDRTDAELAAMSQYASNRLIHSLDFAEGARAFIEKRAPRWQGR